MKSHRSLAIALLLTIAADFSAAQQETVYMSVLASRKHRHGASDNPVVGLFVSTDAGLSWTHRGWREYIRLFHTEPGQGSTVWSAAGNGVLRSTDGGLTWRVTTGSDVTEVLKVRPHPTDPAVVYAATAYGVIRSGDGGETWQYRTTGFRRKFASDIVVDRGNGRCLLAATEQGVYRSENEGKTWVPTSLHGTIANVLLQNPRATREFWAGTEERGVFRSSDGGVRWTSVAVAGNPPVYALAMNPRNPSTIFVGTYQQGVFVSRDGGASWRQSNQGLQNLDVHSLVVIPSDTSVVLAGTLNGGLFRSTDGGTTWTFNSQDDSQAYGLSVRP